MVRPCRWASLAAQHHAQHNLLAPPIPRSGNGSVVINHSARIDEVVITARQEIPITGYEALWFDSSGDFGSFENGTARANHDISPTKACKQCSPRNQHSRPRRQFAKVAPIFAIIPATRPTASRTVGNAHGDKSPG